MSKPDEGVDAELTEIAIIFSVATAAAPLSSRSYRSPNEAGFIAANEAFDEACRLAEQRKAQRKTGDRSDRAVTPRTLKDRTVRQGGLPKSHGKTISDNELK